MNVYRLVAFALVVAICHIIAVFFYLPVDKLNEVIIMQCKMICKCFFFKITLNIPVTNPSYIGKNRSIIL